MSSDYPSTKVSSRASSALDKTLPKKRPGTSNANKLGNKVQIHIPMEQATLPTRGYLLSPALLGRTQYTASIFLSASQALKLGRKV